MTKFYKKDAVQLFKTLKLNIKDFDFSYTDIVKGLNVELEHGKVNRLTNITNDDLILTGKIALAHLFENPKYYEYLDVLETLMSL